METEVPEPKKVAWEVDVGPDDGPQENKPDQEGDHATVSPQPLLAPSSEASAEPAPENPSPSSKSDSPEQPIPKPRRRLSNPSQSPEEQPSDNNRRPSLPSPGQSQRPSTSVKPQRESPKQPSRTSSLDETQEQHKLSVHDDIPEESNSEVPTVHSEESVGKQQKPVRQGESPPKQLPSRNKPPPKRSSSDESRGPEQNIKQSPEQGTSKQARSHSLNDAPDVQMPSNYLAEGYAYGGQIPAHLHRRPSNQSDRESEISIPSLQDSESSHVSRRSSEDINANSRRNSEGTSRKSSSTLLSAQDSQIGDGDIEEGNVAHVSVVARVRPLSELESKRNDRVSITFQDETSITIDNDGKTKNFTFNAIFDPTTSQQDVVDKCGIKKMVEKALEGYSCTAFAYGQTGSGKTFTITGPVDNDAPVNYGENYGLIQRSFMYLFDLVQERRKTITYTLMASYLEIYNEQVKDLLNPFGRDSLPVRWSKDKGFYVENLFVVECETQDDIIAVLEEGMSQRQIAHNNINEYSSRSHTIMALQIDLEMPDPDDENLYITKHGRLSFVDLAGSEKVKELGSSGELLTETTNINKSLLTLGNCISALGDSRKRNGHIPYRDSKLTKLLADSLGGTGITLMIACVSPSKYCVSESLNTLRYANRARRIKNKPVVRMDPREKLILSLKREVKLLRNENHYLRERLKFPKGGAIKAIADSRPVSNGTREDDDDDKTPVPESRKVVKRQSTNSSLASSAELFSPKSAADNSLYEMLQEYMMENETLRSENTDLHNIKMRARREHEHLSRENDKLLRKLEELERVFTTSPFSLPSKLGLSRGSSGHSQSTITNSDTTLNLESVNSTPNTLTPTNPLPMSPWKQQQGGGYPGDVQQYKQPSASAAQGSPNQLPPVDGIKGVPNGYRSTYASGQQFSHSPPNAQMPLGAPPQMPYPGPALRQIYPTSSQQGMKNSYPATAQKGSKKQSETSRSFPPPSNSYQNPPQDNGGPPPSNNQGNPRKISPSSFKTRNSPSTHSDAYSSLPSTSSTKSVGSSLSRKDSTRKNSPKNDLQPVAEQGPKKSPRKPLVHQASATSTGGYSKSHNTQPPTASSSNGKLDSIPPTPAAPPPSVKYKPKGTSDMLAQQSKNLTKPPPDSGSLNKINEKLRQELHDLDGEIEYMKYVNKTHGNIQTNATTKGKGKKR